MYRCYLITCLFCLAIETAYAEPARESISLDSCSASVFSRPGNIPVLLTAPHGAPRSQRLEGVDARQGEYQGKKVKQFVTLADAYTATMTEALYEDMSANNLQPFVVIARIHRSQIDFNRPESLAYESPLASACYRLYHRQVHQFISQIRKQWQHGFLLDIHGQSRFPEQIIRGSRNRKSISQLMSRYGTDVSESPQGIYGKLRALGYNIQPLVHEKERYYIGGFTLKTYGSHLPDGIDALQIEIGRDYRKDANRRDQLVSDLSLALQSFYLAFYAQDFVTEPLSR